MKNSITIDGRTVELPQELINQIRECIKPKVPTWDQVGLKHGYEVDINGMAAMYKVKTFAKLLAVADYLNGEWKPSCDSDATTITVDKGKLHTWTRHDITGEGVVGFPDMATALRAIEIFRANGDEQELINFFTK